jgi:hypothetical protein
MSERDPLALAMFAAWVNVPVDQLPDNMRGHTCAATMEAWGRVADAALAHLKSNGAADRIAALEDAVENAEAAQLNLYRQAEHDREMRRRAEEAFNLVAPFVAKFADAVPHYNRAPPQYQGSVFNLDPDAGYSPALSVSKHGQVPLDGPTIADLRMLADAFAQARAVLKGDAR